MVGAGIGVGWDDRFNHPVTAAAEATAAIGPWRGGFGVGNSPSIGDWEVGIAAPAAKIAIDLEEILDFVLGWFFIDFKRDDYGWE
jgi:hypothetical protein